MGYKNEREFDHVKYTRPRCFYRHNFREPPSSASIRREKQVDEHRMFLLRSFPFAFSLWLSLPESIYRVTSSDKKNPTHTFRIR